MLTEREQRYIKEALAVSCKSDYERVHIGTVLVRKNEIIGRGVNLNRPHPLQYKYNTKARRPESAHRLHSEVHALISGRADLVKGSVAYIARMDKTGRMAMCRPCEACEMALKEFGVKAVVYTTRMGVKRETLTP